MRLAPRAIGIRRVAVPLLAVTAIAISAVPAAAGVPPRWAYGVVRDPTETEAAILPAKDRGNSTGGRVSAEKTEPGSVRVTFAGQGANGGTVLVTPLTTKPRACAVGGWSSDGLSTIASVECSDRHGVPTDTPFIVSIRFLRAGDDQVAYLWANNPASAGYIPDAGRQMNGTDPFALNSIAQVETGVWDVTLPDLGAPGGTVQVSSYGGTPARCGVVSWAEDGDDEQVRVRCRTLAGVPTNVRYTLLYGKGQGMAGPDQGKAAYLYAHRKKAASYTPTFRYTSEGGASTVTRQGKGRYRVTLPNMAKGGAAHVTPVGDGSVRCNVASIRRETLPQRISVRCWNAAGKPADARFTLSSLR